MKIIEQLKRLIDLLNTKFGNIEYGKLIILIGGRGSGKSESVKTLCKNVSRHKYVVKFNGDLRPIALSQDDKKEYMDIPRCHIIESEEKINWHDGLFIFEDFPELFEKADKELYNQVINIRHTFLNFIIVCHDISILSKKILKQANAILLYKDANITPHQLASKVGGLKQGWAINRALQELGEYEHLFISFDHKRWHNPALDSRNIKPLHRMLRKKLKETDLAEITYPKKTTKKTVNNDKKWKKTDIQRLIEQEYVTPDIAKIVDTSSAYVWKTKCEMRTRFREEHDHDENITDEMYPLHLKDARKKQNNSLLNASPLAILYVPDTLPMIFNQPNLNINAAFEYYFLQHPYGGK